MILSQTKDLLKSFVVSPDSMATTLHAITLNLFGEDIYTWEPEMFDLEFRDELGVNMPPINQDRLNAIIAAITSDTYYYDWQAFTVISEVMNLNEADFETLTPDLLPAEIAWATTEITLADSDEPPFSTDVSKYVGIILYNNGFLTPPSQLSFAIMPDIYLGSTSGSDINQIQGQESEQNRIINTYVQEMSETLFGQLQSLPWSNEKMIEDLSSEIRKMNFRNTILNSVAE